MPLSEHEENVLAEIERQLAAEDPRFAARARRRRSLGRSARVRLAVLAAIAGVIAVALLGILPSPWNYVSGGSGLLLLLGAILLGVGTLSPDGDNEQVSVPPDERA